MISPMKICIRGSFVLMVMMCGYTNYGQEPQKTGNAKGTVRELLWMWGHAKGSHNGSWNLPKNSTVTMMDSCKYMGVPNIMVVEYRGKPSPETAEQYMKSLSGCKQICWSVVGAGGSKSVVKDHITPVKTVLGLAEKYPNITSVMLDDYFVRKPARCTVDQLKEMRQMLRSGPRLLDIWVVVYNYQIDNVPQEHLDLVDAVAFWTWVAGHLKDMEKNFETLRARVPGKKIILGCYMWDYGMRRPISLEDMSYQCEIGLKWLKEGKIEGMIFLPTCITDLNIDAVEWTRQWIAEVGDQKLEDVDLAKMKEWSEKTVAEINKKIRKAQIEATKKPVVTATSTHSDKYAPANLLKDDGEWLAANSVKFPVKLIIEYPAAQNAKEIELVQSSFRGTIYRSKDYILEISKDGNEWIKISSGTMPNQAEKAVRHSIPENITFTTVRITILDSHSSAPVRSCGLNRVRLL